MKKIFSSALFILILLMCSSRVNAEPRYVIRGDFSYEQANEGWAGGLGLSYALNESYFVRLESNSSQTRDWWSFGMVNKYPNGAYFGGGINYTYKIIDLLLPGSSSASETSLQSILGYELQWGAVRPYFEHNLLLTGLKNRITMGVGWYI